MVLRLLEEREAALVRVRVKESPWRSGPYALRGAEESNRRPNHRVSKAQHVDTRDAIAYVGMCARQIVQDVITPVRPVTRRELLPCLLRRDVGERMIVRPDGAVLEGSQRLMR